MPQGSSRSSSTDVFKVLINLSLELQHSRARGELMPDVRVMLCSPAVPTESAQALPKGPAERHSLASSPLAMPSVRSALSPLSDLSVFVYLAPYNTL